MNGNLYRVSSTAEADIDSIGAFIQRDNPVRAESFIREMIDKFDVIAERPLSFPARPDLLPGLRCAVHGKYLILFVIEQQVIEIARVVHGSRDLEELF